MPSDVPTRPTIPPATFMGRMWVTLTIGLITFLVISSQTEVLLPAYTYPSSRNPTTFRSIVLTLFPFNILAGFLLWNYYKCVTTDPGGIPFGYKPSQEGMSRDHVEIEVKKLTGKPRFCRMCNGYKPPRTHHCRTCKRCVLRMDHHCPWVNNCIGHYNHSYFIRFLFFVTITTSFHLYLITTRTFGPLAYISEPTIREVIFLILNYTFGIPVFLAVGGFCVYHVFGLLNNTTTIEGWEKDKVATLRRRGRIQNIKFPYDLGYVENIKTVLGESAFLWCITGGPRGDGTFWKVRDGEGEEVDWIDEVHKERRKERDLERERDMEEGWHMV